MDKPEHGDQNRFQRLDAHKDFVRDTARDVFERLAQFSDDDESLGAIANRAAYMAIMNEGNFRMHPRRIAQVVLYDVEQETTGNW